MIDNKLVDKIAWWIPNKNIRNLLREYCNSQNNIEYNLNNSLEYINSILKSQFENSITHFSAFNPYSNAGDNILVTSLRDEIDKFSNKSYVYVHRNVRDKISDEVISIANQTKCIIIGGGGLFLKDTNANEVSGWQFPISINSIDKIKVPLFLVAVGYNRFRNQDDFEPYFKDNINKIAEKCVFIGLRNNGSVEALKNYVEPKYHNKLIYYPCATTLLSKIYTIPKFNIKEKFVAINCAFDRETMRFGNKKDYILNSIANVLKKFSKDYKIKFYRHMYTDEKILPYFDDAKIEYEIVDLFQNIGTEKFLEYYSTPELVLAFRGHAQLIPFGCNTPTLSIISHDKLKWFLEDINHLEYGIDVNEEYFEEKLLEKVNYMLENRQKIILELKEAQEKLYKITLKNIKIIQDKTRQEFLVMFEYGFKKAA